MGLEHGENRGRTVVPSSIARVVAVINPRSGAGLDSRAAVTRTGLVRDVLARRGLVFRRGGLTAADAAPQGLKALADKVLHNRIEARSNFSFCLAQTSKNSWYQRLAEEI